MAAFKQHASFGLWQGDLVVGSEGRNPGDGMGQFGRLTRLADLPGKRELAAYIRQAAKLIEEGATRPAAKNREPRPAADVPDDLLAALGKNASARAAFEAFPPSAKREYVEWITEAKREETRTKRLAQAIEWMADGKRRNWKYENC
jgi:uncharacterized protein YdeI (YjbR/CyaY-like superfamily)